MKSVSISVLLTSVFALISCARAPASMPAENVHDTSTNLSGQTDFQTSEQGNDYETDNNNENGSIGTDQDDETTYETDDTPTVEDTYPLDTASTPPFDTESDMETEDTGNAWDCPWECHTFDGSETCSDIGELWVHNTNFTCPGSKEICCQAIGSSGGLSESCPDQPAFSCQRSCDGTLIDNPDYYCDSAGLVCCEDPAGPIPSCENAGGSCIGLLSNCPAGSSRSELDCGFLNKCCLPPECPWECLPDVGSRTCTQTTGNPDAVRNDNYSCEGVDEICCQPLDVDEGVQEFCEEFQDHNCREACNGYENQAKDLYCKSANRICCEDPRPMCEVLGGECEWTLLSGCPDGWEENEGGICDSSFTSCCTEASALNTCARDGGTCVDLGKSCPLLPIPHLPSLTKFCGLELSMCCMPVF